MLLTKLINYFICREQVNYSYIKRENLINSLNFQLYTYILRWKSIISQVTKRSWRKKLLTHVISCLHQQTSIFFL